MRVSNIVYLDNASSTITNKKVIYICYIFDRIFYSSYSNIALGGFIRKAVNISKSNISRLINASPNNIFFTSCATESNNIVIKSFISSGYFMVSSYIEHDSIYNIISSCVGSCFINVDKFGFYDLDDLRRLTRGKKNVFVSLSWVNSELGNVQDIYKISSIVKGNSFSNIIHIDASQALGKVDIDVEKLNVDFISFSSNKIHGPRGIGFLYVSSSSFYKLSPLLSGGNQQKGFRSGSLPIQLIVSLGEICRVTSLNFNLYSSIVKYLSCFFLNSMVVNVPGFRINGCYYGELVGIFSFYIKGVSRFILNSFCKRFAYSYSTSCSDQNNYSSRVLKFIDVSLFSLKNSIRVSLCRYNTIDDINSFIRAVLSIFSNYLI